MKTISGKTGFGALVFSMSVLLMTVSYKTVAENFTVTNVPGLVAALAAAEWNGEADTVFLVAGTYTLTSSLGFYSEEDYSVTLTGPYDAPAIIDANGFQGLYIQTTAANAHITIQNLTFENGNAGYGGGCQGETASANFYVINCNFSNNTASEAGGGLSIYTFDGVVTVENSVFEANLSSGNDAGGLFVGSDGGTMQVSGCVFSGNSAQGDDAGGCMLYSDNSGTAVITNSVFENNFAADDAGGAMVYLLGAGSFASVHNNDFSQNTATLGGGGFWLRMPAGGEVEYYDNIHSANNTLTANGGGAYFEMNQGKLEIYNNGFSENNAAQDGGAVWIEHYSDTVTIHHNTFYENNSANNGGGLQIFTDMGTANIYRNIFNANGATVIGGGISAATTGGNFNVYNNTLYQNGSDDGSGLYFYFDDPSANAYVFNNIIWECLLGDPVNYSGAASVVATYCDIQGGEGYQWFGTGCFDENPKFSDPGNGDFNLSWANYPVNDTTKSPCIDAGDPASQPDPDGSVPDVGALWFDPETGIMENNLKFIVYPNPALAFHAIHIQMKMTDINDDISLSVFDETGKKESVDFFRMGKEFIIPGLGTGIHVVLLTGNGKIIYRKKLVVVK